MLKRQHAAVVLVTCVALFTGATPRAAAQDATAADLLEQGITLMEAGDVQAAKVVLEQVDAIALSKEQRQTLYSTLTDIETKLSETPAAPTADATPDAPAAPAEVEAPVTVDAEEAPNPQQVLSQADAAATKDPGTAIALYTSLIEQGGAIGETAKARMADLLRGLNADVTRAKRTLDSAEADLASGQLDAAETKFAAVSASGVELGWFDEQRISRGEASIAEARQASGETSAPATAVEPTQQAAAPAAETAAPRQATAPAGNDLMVEARKTMAREYHRDAEQAMAEGYDTLAMNLLAKAEELDPDNPAIQASVERANANGAGKPQLNNAIDNFKITRDATLDAYNNAMTDARDKRDAGDFSGAANDVSRAKTRIESRQEFFSISEYNNLRNEATQLSVEIDQQRNAAFLKQQEIARVKQIQDEQEAIEAAEKENAKEVRNLIVQARQLQKEVKYDEALLLLERALFIDANNYTAQLLKEVIEDAKIAVTYRDLTRQKRLEGAKNALMNVEAIIPYTKLITYPEDWPELSDTRLRGLDDTGGESEANRETARKLQKTVPINFDANPLESVIDYIRETTDANIFVNWPALIDQAFIEQDAPISLTLNNVPAEKALQLVLQQASSQGGTEVSYSLIDGVVTISTAEDLKRSTDLRVYDIRDLLVQVPNFTDAPEFDLTESLSNTNSGGGGGGGGGGGSSIFGDDNDNDNDEDDAEEERQELIDSIITLIQETVGDFNDWAEGGGGESTVQELNSNLIIKTTPDNHRGVHSLLAQLRETRAVQISVEARFLLVDRNFLEEVVVDLDVAWQGQSNRGVRTDPFTGLPANEGFSPIVASQNSGASRSADGEDFGLANAAVGQIGYEPFFTSNPALGLGVSFIDDLSVNFLVEATLANRNSISLTAPRVTFFNGQRAYVTIARQVSFISDVEPVPDSAGFDITISVTQAGVVLDVEGTISADRRYVTLTLRPSLADIVEIQDFPIGATAIIEGDEGEDDIIITSDIGVQLPILDITTVRATVSVPDRGTLLVGGQRLVGETEVEAGVPVLSKIPILNRLFTNTSKVEDERTLLILIKPTIIIQNEREEEAFPGITENLQELSPGFR